MLRPLSPVVNEKSKGTWVTRVGVWCLLCPLTTVAPSRFVPRKLLWGQAPCVKSLILLLHAARPQNSPPRVWGALAQALCDVFLDLARTLACARSLFRSLLLSRSVVLSLSVRPRLVWISKGSSGDDGWTCRALRAGTTGRVQGYRGTPLKRNCFLLGTYGRPMPRTLRWSKGGGHSLMSEVTLYLAHKKTPPGITCSYEKAHPTIGSLA